MVFKSFVTSFLFTSQNDITDIFVTKLNMHWNIHIYYPPHTYATTLHTPYIHSI